jgi:hypothetical protein
MSESQQIRHHFVIEPLVGVGPIRLGMHKDEVSHAFTYAYRSFFKTPESKVRSDMCEMVGLIIHYDDYRRVKQIESYQPKDDSGVTMELYGQDVTKMTMREALNLISPHGENMRELLGFDFPELGLSLRNHRYKTDADPVGHFVVGPAFPFDPYGTRLA